MVDSWAVFSVFDLFESFARLVREQPGCVEFFEVFLGGLVLLVEEAGFLPLRKIEVVSNL